MTDTELPKNALSEERRALNNLTAGSERAQSQASSCLYDMYKVKIAIIEKKLQHGKHVDKDNLEWMENIKKMMKEEGVDMGNGDTHEEELDGFVDLNDLEPLDVWDRCMTSEAEAVLAMQELDKYWKKIYKEEVLRNEEKTGKMLGALKISQECMDDAVELYEKKYNAYKDVINEMALTTNEVKSLIYAYTGMCGRNN